MKEFIKNKTKIDESYDVLKMFCRQLKFKLSYKIVFVSTLNRALTEGTEPSSSGH